MESGMRELKAFTLIEVLFAMAITAICVAACVWAFNNLNSVSSRLTSSLAFEEDAVFILSDVESRFLNGDTIIFGPDHFQLGNVRYTAIEGGTIRQQGQRIDTCIVAMSVLKSNQVDSIVNDFLQIRLDTLDFKFVRPVSVARLMNDYITTNGKD